MTNSLLEKEPYMKDEYGKWNEVFTFSSWSKHKALFEPYNPNTLKATEDTTFYADYVLSSYDNTKYSAMLSFKYLGEISFILSSILTSYPRKKFCKTTKLKIKIKITNI